MKTSEINDKLYELSNRDKSIQFTKDELKFLKAHVNTSKWKIHYVLYNKESSKNTYVGFVIDYMSNNPRGRKPEHYSMNVICSRKLNDEEIMWELKNYGCRNRRFYIYWVSSILWVQQMDILYGIETPKEFVDICNEKGYNSGTQTYMNF